jgi:ribosomal protein L12E/L44/L45/RPP1/RPP2
VAGLGCVQLNPSVCRQTIMEAIESAGAPSVSEEEQAEAEAEEEAEEEKEAEEEEEANAPLN